MTKLLVLVLLVIGMDGQAQPTGEKTFLEKGLEAEENGKYEEALNIWLQSKSELSVPNTAIGRNYIRVVTEQQFTDFYQAASAMYQWGISADNIEPNREALQKEIAFLEPLLEKGERNEWEELLENSDPGLYKKLQLFWQQMDPTPASTYNERLIEHWERIAYARKNYTRGDDSVYGTDERGPVYIRYGQPDRVSKDRLRATLAEAERIATGERVQKRNIANAVMRFHEDLEYEIWIYNAQNNDMKYNLVMMFGEKPESGGSFDRINTVEDFIPRRAFSISQRYNYIDLSAGQSNTGAVQSSGRTTISDIEKPSDDVERGKSPGMVMQQIYYDQLASVDSYFGDLYAQLLLTYEAGIEPIQKSHGFQYKQKHVHLTRKNLNAAPQEESTYKKEFPEIPIEIHQYRLLDVNNRPYFATFLESKPLKAFLSDLAKNQDAMLPDSVAAVDSVNIRQAFSHYRLVHGLQIRNADYELLAYDKQEPPIVVDPEEDLPSGSVFKIPFVSEDSRQVFFAELYNYHDGTKPPISSPFPDNLRGHGKVEISQPEPLKAEPGELEMGDLILGYQMKEEPSPGSLFPFVVATSKEIPFGEDLAIHYEVYHLEPNAEGIAKFQLKYEILPVNFLGWTKNKKEEFSLTLNLETDETRFTEDIEIRTRVLEPGKYVLRMQATDTVGGGEVQREIEFRVEDKKPESRPSRK